MDAAVMTGMLNIGANSSFNYSLKDVGKSKDSDFNEIFSKNLKKEKEFKVEKENNKKDVKNEEVNTKDENKIEDVKKEEKVEDKKTDNKKDEKIDEDEKINYLAENIIKEVNNLDVQNIDELKEMISKLEDVKNIEVSDEELLKLQEVLNKRLEQNVDEVGPQSVETEKITLNEYDELESKLDALGEKLGMKKDDVKSEDVNLKEENMMNLDSENLNSNIESSFSEEKGLDNKNENGKDKKFNVTDFRKKDVTNTNVEQIDIDVKPEIEDVNIVDVNKVYKNEMTNMKEQIDVIKQLSEKIDINLFEDKSEMIVKLKPDHLGKVTVEIAMENGSITAKFLAESEKVKEILESNMQDLKDHLAKQGMVVQDLSVSVGDRDREPLFRENSYNSFKKRQKIEEVSGENYLVENSYGIDDRNILNFYPDSTISFSA